MNRVFTYIVTLLLSVSPLLMPVVSEAVTPEEKGLNIAQESDRRASGFGSNEVELRMTLKSSGGKETLRELHMKTLEVRNDGDKTLVVFDSPRDIRGTAFLSFAHKVGNDEQWLYLPALKRVKRIASSNKSSPFMGSEFSYEDMAAQEVEKFTYKWLRDETMDKTEFFVVERYPVEKENSGYSRQVVWVDKAEYRPMKIEYYDKDGELLKTLLLSDYRVYKEKFWEPLSMNMNNHQTGKSTLLEFKDYSFGVDLDERDFTQDSLRRAR